MLNAYDHNELLDYILVLRTLVLALGEISNPPWWRTKFMSNVGISFLQRIYPRTYFLAALNSAGKAARDIHDQSVGKVGVFHLFRLCSSEIITMLEDKDKLLQALIKINKSIPVNSLSSGAVNIGSEASSHEYDTYNEMAAIYQAAFEKGKQAFPYMSTERVPR